MAYSSAFPAGPSGAKPKPFITWQRFVVYSVLVVCAIFFLFPLYIMIITSLKDIETIRAGNIFVPTMEPTFDAWIKAWDSACTGLYCEGIKVGFWNSVKITVPSTIVSSIRKCSSLSCCCRLSSLTS